MHVRPALGRSERQSPASGPGLLGWEEKLQWPRPLLPVQSLAGQRQSPVPCQLPQIPEARKVEQRMSALGGKHGAVLKRFELWCRSRESRPLSAAPDIWKGVCV